MGRNRMGAAEVWNGRLVSAPEARSIMAEGEGFEPPDLSINGFQDRRLRPLGHPSKIHASA